MNVWLLTIYQNGIRYYSAPVPPPDKEERSRSDVSISTPSLLVFYEKYNSGDCFISIKQAISQAEFELYKRDQLSFTAKSI